MRSLNRDNRFDPGGALWGVDSLPLGLAAPEGRADGRRTNDRAPVSNVYGYEFRYRPGWSFFTTPTAIYAEWHGVSRMEGAGTVTISIPIKFNGPEPPRSVLTRAEVVDLVLALIVQIETHERLEDLEIDGEVAFEPHPTGKANDFESGEAIMHDWRARIRERFNLVLP